MKNEKRYNIDEALVKEFAKGDMKAFDCIYIAFSSKLQKFIFSLIKAETDTEDLVHEVFVKVWENRERMKSYKSFESYLFTIAYNATISLLRNRAKDSQFVEYIQSVQVEIEQQENIEEFDQGELKKKLDLLITQMPPRQQEVFKMKQFQDCSYKEIADTLGISVNTVENHIAKAHKFLKSNLRGAYFPTLLFIHLFL